MINNTLDPIGAQLMPTSVCAIWSMGPAPGANLLPEGSSSERN
jgi:hypothetical protein